MSEETRRLTSRSGNIATSVRGLTPAVRIEQGVTAIILWAERSHVVRAPQSAVPSLGRLFRPTVFSVAVVAAIAMGGPAESEAPPPKSAAAKGAIAKHNDALKAALDAYKKAVTAAKHALIQELDDALRAAMNSGDLAEANAINTAKAKTRQEIDDLAGGRPVLTKKPRTVTVKVAVKDRWKQVGKVYKGDVLEFNVTGEWLLAAVTRDRSWGPDGDGNRAMFMAKVGDTLYRIGAKATVEVKETGVLYVGNDESTGGGKGEMTAVIALYRGGKSSDAFE